MIKSAFLCGRLRPSNRLLILSEVGEIAGSETEEHTIEEDSFGNIWIGTSGGLNCFDGHRFIQYRTTNGLPNNFIRSLLEDKDGNIWIGTHNGLCRFVPDDNGTSGTLTYFSKKATVSSDVFPRTSGYVVKQRCLNTL